ncbi:Uma2 family endonuclease [Fibrella aquatica]|jgi:Uma2 family endonuclease|uniref:Uma2 family endonuclease n=1 Tax=Fibrella aquatica TaxID=3242487 RepID=UPI003521CC8D
MILPLNPVLNKDERLSDDEFFAFCQANPSLRIEREETGQIIFEMPTGINTSITNSALNGEVYLWNRQHKLGFTTDSNGGFTLPDNSVRAPDVAWISRERWALVPESDRDKFAHVCPDFVIELMSDTDEKYTLPAKMEKYLQNGVRLGWQIDPFTEQTTVYRPDQQPEVVPFCEVLSGGDVLPNFLLRLSDLANN